MLALGGGDVLEGEVIVPRIESALDQVVILVHHQIVERQAHARVPRPFGAVLRSGCACVAAIQPHPIGIRLHFEWRVRIHQDGDRSSMLQHQRRGVRQDLQGILPEGRIRMILIIGGILDVEVIRQDLPRRKAVRVLFLELIEGVVRPADGKGPILLHHQGDRSGSIAPA